MPISPTDLVDLPLFDHHCHGVRKGAVDREGFEAMISESSRPATEGTTRFDSQVGFQVRAHCAPILGLDQFCTPEDYLAQRALLGVDEVNQRLLRAARITTYGIGTGPGAGVVHTPERMAELANAAAHEIVRLERIVETVIETVRDESVYDHPTVTLLDRLETELDARLETAIGVKSIAAYRIGLDFDPARPGRAELEASAERLLSIDGEVRLDDPVMIRHMIHLAIDRGCVIQFHIGYGDDDVDLHRCNPLLLTELLRYSVNSGARFTLLHCYPFHREAGYLADVFPHVYFDIGLAINYTGARSNEIIAESLELAPFGKILFSSDAWGAPELFLLGAHLFRRGLAEALGTFQARDGWPDAECLRIARMIGYDNAARVYRIDDRKDATA